VWHNQNISETNDDARDEVTLLDTSGGSKEACIHLRQSCKQCRGVWIQGSLRLVFSVEPVATSSKSGRDTHLRPSTGKEPLQTRAFYGVYGISEFFRDGDSPCEIGDFDGGFARSTNTAIDWSRLRP